MAIDIDKLMSGVGIVIDDAFRNDKDKKDDIFKIIKQIEDKNIPVIKYDALPDDVVSHFKNVSFILLDWNLNQIVPSAEEPVRTPSGLESSNVEYNIEFIKNIKKVCFTPFFIFTKENVDEIINNLTDAGLYTREKHNFIFVINKSEVKSKGRLFLKITKWLEKTPSIYVLKEWEISLNEAKNTLFWDFYNINQEWPKILWEAYKSDTSNMSNELGELITRNLTARMTSFAFESSFIEKRIRSIAKEDIRKVMEGERFIKKKYLDEQETYTGDIFKISSNYFINIRPQCDLKKDSRGEVILYCIKGSKISVKKEKKFFNKINCNFVEQIDNAIVFSIDEGKTIDFRFKEIKRFCFSRIQDKRIGRLLPPYITRIQQRYALYFQRQGLPPTPKKAVQ